MTVTPSPLSVLLIDDEVEFASTLAERLGLRNYSVTVACDGESALREVAAKTPDCVLLDVMLPGMSGIEVLRRIRETHPVLPVILLTGLAGAREGIEGMKQGALAYLTKPIDFNELLEVISRVQTGDPHA